MCLGEISKAELKRFLKSYYSEMFVNSIFDNLWQFFEDKNAVKNNIVTLDESFLGELPRTIDGHNL
jgi:hypothetical protein